MLLCIGLVFCSLNSVLCDLRRITPRQAHTFLFNCTELVPLACVACVCQCAFSFLFRNVGGQRRKLLGGGGDERKDAESTSD